MFDICEARSFSCENKKALSHLVFVIRDYSHNKDTVCVYFTLWQVRFRANKNVIFFYGTVVLFKIMMHCSCTAVQ